MQPKILCLRDVNLYKGIPEKELIRLTDDAVEQYFEKGHVFYSPDSPADHVYVLKSGEIELYREENGKKVVIETILAGDVFGDFGIGETTHFARACSRSYICSTPRKEFLHIVKNHPEIAFNLMQSLAKKTSEYEEKITSFSKPAKDRLFDELKKMEAKNSRKIWGKFLEIPLRMSHQKLADKVGLNRVTVTKLMNELRNENKIKIDENTNIISILK